MLYKTYEIKNIYPIELAFHYLYGIGTITNKKRAKELFLNVRQNQHNYCVYDIERANYQLVLFLLENHGITQAKKLLLENDHEFSNALLNIIGRSW